MEKQSYSVPEVEILLIENDIITNSFTEDEEWTGPDIGFD